MLINSTWEFLNKSNYVELIPSYKCINIYGFLFDAIFIHKNVDCAMWSGYEFL